MKKGVFVVTHADENSAILKDVSDNQVHTLSSNPGVEENEVIEGVLDTEPPMNVTWELTDIERRWSVSIRSINESPSERALEVADSKDMGEVHVEDLRNGTLHVLTTPPDITEVAVEDILNDESTLVRAADLGAKKVEIRAEEGVISVRYLPD
ncbi:MAG: DUF5812 family protein [Halobacteria archaeon]|nr:DUF5812 family protein [Halobacteria archaeon]